MSSTLEPWQRAEIPRPKRALGIKPEVLSAMVKREDRVLLVVGSEGWTAKALTGW